MADKYREKFKYPEHFRMTGKGISVTPSKPDRSEKERSSAEMQGQRELCIILVNRWIFSQNCSIFSSEF